LEDTKEVVLIENFIWREIQFWILLIKAGKLEISKPREEIKLQQNENQIKRKSERLYKRESRIFL